MLVVRSQNKSYYYIIFGFLEGILLISYLIFIPLLVNLSNEKQKSFKLITTIEEPDIENILIFLGHLDDIISETSAPPEVMVEAYHVAKSHFSAFIHTIGSL